MLQVLQFIFYSFWTWAGTVVLLWTAMVGFGVGFNLVRTTVARQS